MNPIIQRLLETGAEMDFVNGANERDIALYEQSKGFKLPSDYREWLLFSNGGEIFVPGTQFFGVDTVSNYSLVNQNSKEIRSIFSLANFLLIIGRMNFGDLLCIDLNTNEIVQWDHETDEEFLRWSGFFAFLSEEIDSFIDKV